MGTYYAECDEEVYDLLNDILGEYRRDLLHEEVTIKLLFAHGTEGKVAMKSRGQRVLGKCKINPLDDRAQGMTDVTIKLDGDWWPNVKPRRRKALLHHEVDHVLTNGEKDDLGRPKLTMREHDLEMGLFAHICQLYGEDSIEHSLIEHANKIRDQNLLPGMQDGSEPSVSPAEPKPESKTQAEPEPEYWHDSKLRRHLQGHDKLADILEQGGQETLGDIITWLRDGHSLEDLGLTPRFTEILREALLKFREDHGGPAKVDLPLEWLEADEADQAEASSPPPKPRGKKTAKTKAVAT